MIGKTIAHYEVVSLLGKGGMGEVYRARDTRVGREVAIKLLPPELLKDPERVARFQREARTLASLNHPNIAGLHGVEESDGQRFLVMELAEGVDLSQRIAAGTLALDEALAIAEQIAMGLEEAHEKGIIHRDLKPANIKVSDHGTVKILDFGLARAYEGQTVDESDPANSPTLSAAMTMQGTILGTAAYMSPEQAKGKTVDRRADVWSFGVILWEMLTGKRLFEAETTSEVLAAVLRADLEWDELPASTPPGVRRLLKRCLERDPRERLRDIGEARIRLRRWAVDPSSMHESTTGTMMAAREPRSMKTWLPWALVALTALAAAWGWFGRGGGATPSTTSLEMAIELPGDETMPGPRWNGVPLRLSPEGTRLAYVTGRGLFLKQLDAAEVSLVDGSQDVTDFAFSPDGQWVAFLTGGYLYRASVTGGAPIPICAAEDPRGLAWVNDTTIVFPPTYFEPLMRVSIETGEISQLTTLDRSRSERSHRWPMPLPGGRAILMTCQFTGRNYDESDIQIVWLDSGERETVYRGGSYAMYVASGHLLFVRANTLFAIPFDPETAETSGQPLPVLEGLASSVGDQELDNGSARYDVSPRGMLLYRTWATTSRATRVTYLDAATGSLTPFGTEALHTSMAVSPDRRWLAVSRGVESGSEIYLIDTRTRVERRFTDRSSNARLGAFSPDSRTLYWSDTPGDGSWWLLRQPIDGSSPVDSVASIRDTLNPQAFSADGRSMFVSYWSRASAWDIGRIDLQADEPQVEEWIGGPGSQLQCRPSPDGRWFAYFATESGQRHLYLRRHPDTGAVWQLAREGLEWRGMTWAADSGALLLCNAAGVQRIRIEETEGMLDIRPYESVVAAELITSAASNSGYWPLPDGSGAYLLQPSGEEVADDAQTILVTNWLERLAARFANLAAPSR